MKDYFKKSPELLELVAKLLSRSDKHVEFPNLDALIMVLEKTFMALNSQIYLWTVIMDMDLIKLN